MSFRVAHVSGVPVRVHVSSAITFLLLSYLIGIGFIAQADPSLSTLAALSGGAGAALLLFGSLLLHEYGHVICARRFGIEARSVNLFLLGGEAKLTCGAAGWGQELAVAMAGPAVSVLLTAALAGVTWVLEPGSTASIIMFYLAFANGILAAANLLPAYPLDGGRAMHAVLWAVSHDRLRSAKLTALVGEIFGLAAAAYGAYLLLGGGLDGLWAIAIGWYLFNAALQSRADEEGYSRFGSPVLPPTARHREGSTESGE